MKKRSKKTISVILAVLMVCTAWPAFAWAETGQENAKAGEVMTAQAAVTPTRVNEAITKFTDSLSKFYTDTSQMSGISTFLTRFSGVTAAAAGVIGILQMTGVVKDPTQQALGQILDTVHDIQDKLNQMDVKLDSINQQLVSIAVRQEEQDRNNNAKSMLKNWREFNRDYCEPLDKRVDQYEAKITSAIRSWWVKPTGEGVNLLYTSMKDGSVSLTYSNEDFSSGYPATADNGETVDTDYCVTVPSEVLPDTSSIKFNVDTYRDVFTQKMAENFIDAANKHQLPAGERFYHDWDGSFTESERAQMAKNYANDVLNTVNYRIACDVMSGEHEWATDVISEYKNFCSNVLAQDSGVNAMLNAMYLTHGFEGEIKTDIQDFCDQMAVKAGVYGQFALTCAGQDELMALDKRQEVQSLFTDTVINLHDKKDKALTGHDNYCYITGTLLEHDVIDATSETTIKYTIGATDAYKGYESKDWTITVPSILDSVYAQVLFRQYKTLNAGESAFSTWLKNNGAFPTENWTGDIMTKYNGPVTFPLSEGIWMEAAGIYASEDYFSSGSSYRINLGNESKIEDKYFSIHDKVMYDAFNFGTGEMKVNQMGAARAMYGENHSFWTADECWFFCTSGANYRNAWDRDSTPRWQTEKYRARFNVMKLNPVHDMNGDPDPDDPFFAFDGPSLTDGVSNQIDPDYEDTAKALTAVKMQSGAFTYTGEAIEPKVTVKAGKETVPADGYEITYADNTDPGFASVTVAGTGDYSGSIQEQFRIVPEGTDIIKVKKKKTAATVTWETPAAELPSPGITGYQIRYSTKASMKKAKKIKVKGADTTSLKIRKLKKKKKYYFQIRTCMQENVRVLASGWSKKKAAK